MGNGSISEVFPEPVELVVSEVFPPVWCLAIIAAVVAVSVLWIIAIVVLILFEIFGSKGRSSVPSPSALSPSALASSVLISRSRAGSYNSFVSSPSLQGFGVAMGTPPPSVRPPRIGLVGVEGRGLHTGGAELLSNEAPSSPPPPPPPPPSFQEERDSKPKLSLADEPTLSRTSSYASSIISHGSSMKRSNPTSFRSSARSSARASARSNVSSMMSNQSFDQDEVKEKPIIVGGGGAGAGVEGATDLTSRDGSEDGAQSPLSGMVLSRPVTIRQLGATIREPSYVETEFRKLPVLRVSRDTMPPGTERKNRYTNVLPTCETRVVLPEVFGYSNSDYINANFIRGYKGAVKQYIATQGPLENTVEDFWRMILDNETSVIVMVTNFQEKGIEKCTRYWPAQGSEGYGNIQVTLMKQTAHGTYNSSTLQVQATGAGQATPRTVTHYRLTCWPQQGVPKDTKIITDFLKKVKLADCNGPAVVHCSAGIGRTGVLIACDIGLQGILQGEPRIDVLRIVSTLRQDRNGMVQTRDQYRFIHQALYNMAKE